MSDANSQTKPGLSVTVSHNKHLKVFNKATGAPDDLVAFTANVSPVGFGQQKVTLPSFKHGSIDISASMLQALTKGGQHERMEVARSGGHVFLDSLSPTDYFSLGAFGTHAKRVYPQESGPVLATPANIKAAKRAIDGLEADTERAFPHERLVTRAAAALLFFRQDVLALKGKIGVAYLGLLTDGAYHDAVQVGDELKQLKLLKDQVPMSVLCFGISDEWNFEQLRQISAGLGSADPIYLSDPGLVKSAFAKLATADANLTLRRVTMVVRIGEGTEITGWECSRPVFKDYLGDGLVTFEGEQLARVDLGTWGGEERILLLELKVQMPSNKQAIAAIVTFETEDGMGQVGETEPEMVDLVWTANSSATVLVDPNVQKAMGDRLTKLRMMEAGTLAEQGDRRGAQEIIMALYATADANNDVEAKTKREQLATFTKTANGFTAELKGQGKDAGLAIKTRATRLRSIED